MLKVRIWLYFEEFLVTKFEIDILAGSERGQTHADTFILQEAPGKWKWSSTKPGGRRPTPRSGVSCVTAPNGKV